MTDTADLTLEDLGFLLDEQEKDAEPCDIIKPECTAEAKYVMLSTRSCDHGGNGRLPLCETHRKMLDGATLTCTICGVPIIIKSIWKIR